MPKTKNKAGIHLHKSHSGQWYWFIFACNGRELARSSETYSTKKGAVKSIIAVAKHFDNNQHYYDHTTKIQPHLVAYDL